MSRELKQLTLLFLGAAFFFGILASLVANNLTNAFDTSVLLWINQYSNQVLDLFFLSVTNFGGVRFVAIVSVALALYLLYRKQYTNGALVILGMGGAVLLGAVFKAVFERTRPDLWEWLISETSFSFPSGHATASMALAFLVIILVWRTRWRLTAVIIGSIYVVLIGVSRLYLGVHYPTDILGGWLLSLGWVSVVALGCLLTDRGRTKV